MEDKKALQGFATRENENAEEEEEHQQQEEAEYVDDDYEMAEERDKVVHLPLPRVWSDLEKSGVRWTAMRPRATFDLADEVKTHLKQSEMVPKEQAGVGKTGTMEWEMRAVHWHIDKQVVGVDESVFDTLLWRLQDVQCENLEIYDEFIQDTKQDHKSKTRWRTQRPWDGKDLNLSMGSWLKNVQQRNKDAKTTPKSKAPRPIQVKKTTLHKESVVLNGNKKEGWGLIWSISSEDPKHSHRDHVDPDSIQSTRHKFLKRFTLEEFGIQVDMSRVISWSRDKGLNPASINEIEIECLHSSMEISESDWIVPGVLLLCSAFYPVSLLHEH